MAKANPEAMSTEDWATGTKIVDGDGSPLVLYHGTTVEFDQFLPSKRGLFGCGIYLTDSHDDALEFAGEEGPVLEVCARLIRPFYTTGDYEPGEALDIDSPAIPLLQALYGYEFKKFIALMDGSGLLGETVSRDLQRMGHDGIVVQWPAYAGRPGVQHVIVFDPSQVRFIAQADAPSPMRYRH